jgi:NAD+ synthase
MRDVLLPFDPEVFVRHFEIWVKEYIERSGAKGTVSGLSGGLDSAVVAALLNRVFKDKHLALFVNIESSMGDREDARLVANHLGLNYKEIDLTAVYKQLLQVLPPDNGLARANLKPRLRMGVFYYFANLDGRLVAGTGNKSELMVGYFTKFGDGACDFLPIGSLYKTQVRELARYLGIPEKIILKPPSAGLWVGQTDEGELGITYSELDKALYFLEQGKEEEIDLAIRTKVLNLIKKSEHKRLLPPVFKI